MSPDLDPNSVGDHLDRLFRAAWALTGNQHDAEDLVQDTYLRVFAKPRWLRNDDDLGYMLRSLRNTFLTKRRDAARKIQHVLRHAGNDTPKRSNASRTTTSAAAARRHHPPRIRVDRTRGADGAVCVRSQWLCEAMAAPAPAAVWRPPRPARAAGGPALVSASVMPPPAPPPQPACGNEAAVGEGGDVLQILPECLGASDIGGYSERPQSADLYSRWWGHSPREITMDRAANHSRMSA